MKLTYPYHNKEIEKQLNVPEEYVVIERKVFEDMLKFSKKNELQKILQTLEGLSYIECISILRISREEIEKKSILQINQK